MKSIAIKDLKEGDIFQFGANVWDSPKRLHGVRFYNDKMAKWQDKWSKECRICFWLSYVYGDGKFTGMIKWSDTDSLEQMVYIPEYRTSEWKRLKGKYVYIISNQHYPFQYELSDINKQPLTHQ